MVETVELVHCFSDQLITYRDIRKPSSGDYRKTHHITGHIDQLHVHLLMSEGLIICVRVANRAENKAHRKRKKVRKM